MSHDDQNKPKETVANQATIHEQIAAARETGDSQRLVELSKEPGVSTVNLLGRQFGQSVINTDGIGKNWSR